ncbi:MAG: hypothetical protein IKM32_01135 [Clostridia bacterium]|nr:hypothetical protein [Clostridia bacterium]MBR6783274.1 hypothetical protein [Clostridia bacterium]
MKKHLIPLIIVALILTVLPLCAMNSSAESAADENNIPDDTLINYGYLQKFKEELKQELIEELTAQGGITIATVYEDVSFKEGQIIILAPDCEIIYRGGGAVVITSSNSQNEGITDMAEGRELFSGEPLEYGHIYFASESESHKAILITGGTAYFTVRGDYEIA